MSFHNLKVNEKVLEDNSITKYQYHSYKSYSETFNNNDEIRIAIRTNNVYTLPSESYIYIEGRLLKEDGTVSNTLKFINNGISFLFDEIRYEINGTTIDSNRNPGITSTLKSYVSHTQNQMTHLQNAGFSHLEYPNIVDANGNFNVCIRLSLLLGMMEDYKKVILNVPQDLILIRSNSDLNCVVNNPDTGTDKPKIKINKLVWRMPHIAVDDINRLSLMENVNSNNDIPIAFRSWQLHELPLVHETTNNSWTVKTTSQIETPRFVIFGFQTERKNELNRNMSYYDDCNLNNIKLYLNSDVFPYDNIDINFNKNQYGIFYEMFSQFQQSYYQKKEIEPCLSRLNFKQIAPIAVIDCSHQSETTKNGAVDIRIEFECLTNIPPKTSAYCLILHDKFLTYNPLTGIVKFL